MTATLLDLPIRTPETVSVHGVTENHHGDAEEKEKQGQKERRQGPDGRSEGGEPPPK